MSRLGVIIPLCIVVTTLLGCSGSNVPVQNATAPHPDNATVEGTVVRADAPQFVLPRAIVREETTGRQVETNNLGQFQIAGLPAMENARLVVETPRDENYDGATVLVPTRANSISTVNIAVLPVAVGSPTLMYITPENPVIEEGGTVQFAAAVQVGGVRVEVQPTWIVFGDDVGGIDVNGLLGSVRGGLATVRAISGNMIAETNLTVSGPTPPDISTVLVSASEVNPVAAGGGVVWVTVAATDGDGIATVFVDVFPQQADQWPVSPFAVAPIPGTTSKDGTWRVPVPVGPNDNQPDQDGNQAPQMYSLRVRAVDITGTEAIYRDPATGETEFFDFAVAGLDPPPPPLD